jgi:cysteinyl-tRNA synthetase
VVNFTDVDDKIIRRAQEIGEDPQALAERYIKEFMAQLDALNVTPATAYPRATQTMDQIIAFVEELIAKGHAYAAEGDVYFRVRSDPDYGRLAGRSLDEMMAGTRFEVDPRKEFPADFALWKAAKPGEPSWPSPWGEGRPGWHIECSSMARQFLGDEIDIHGGGSDLVFPHHENEIAQSESATGKPFARFFLHNGMLELVNAQTRKVEKMSKSLGNVVTISGFLERYDADVLRLAVLGSHYRSPLTYNSEIADDTARKLERLMTALEPSTGSRDEGPDVEALSQAAEAARAGFTEAMDQDLNTAGALGVLFDFVRAINVARDAGVTSAPLSAAQNVLRELAGVLGLRLRPSARKGQDIAPFVELLIETRAALRKAKQFELADSIRKRLADLGVTLEDGPQGTRWK